MRGAALLALVAPFALASCVADSVSLRITCNVVPETDCTYTTGGLCYLGGTLNIASADRYFSVLRVTNGLKPRARDVPPQSEPNGVTIKEIEVELTDSAGRKPTFARELPNPFTVQGTGFAKPTEDALVGAELLPRAYVDALKTLQSQGKGLSSLRLSVIARGVTDGDVEVETAGYPWPIDVRIASDDPGLQQKECVEFEDAVCSLGQDTYAYACDPALVTGED